MKLRDAIKWPAHNLFCLCTSPAILLLFDKRIKPWEFSPVFFLNAKIKNKSNISAVALILKQNTYRRDFIITLPILMFFTWVKDRPQHRELRALYSLRIVCSFFNVPHSWDSKELWDGTSGRQSLKKSLIIST